MTDPVTTPAARFGLRQRVAGQGLLLFTGFSASQTLSFLRNALLGYGLSRGDFGIAASITLLLQMIESLSDLGADRMIVQATDGDAPRLMATAHTLLALRGLLTALALAGLAVPAAHYFHVPEAAWAFAAMAVVPLLKGFTHLDQRRRQRVLDNRAVLISEVGGQFLALALAAALVLRGADYAVAVWAALAQVGGAVLLSHLLAERPYRLAFDRAHLARLFTFGWPILLSALPLIAVYQGDRLIVARLLGIEALASFSAAFLLTMVPGLLAARISHALALPLLAQARDDADLFRRRCRLTAEASLLLAAGYVAIFIMAGEVLVRLAFGPAYGGIGAVTSWLAVMWGVRMIQVPAGMALMAEADTRPLLIAAIVRAFALLPAFGFAYAGYGLASVAAAGALGELVSLLYISAVLGRRWPGLAGASLTDGLLLMAIAAGALGIGNVLTAGTPALARIVGALLAGLVIMLALALILPETRKLLAAARTPWRTRRREDLSAKPSAAPAPAGPSPVP